SQLSLILKQNNSVKKQTLHKRLFLELRALLDGIEMKEHIHLTLNFLEFLALKVLNGTQKAIEFIFNNRNI
ncbi:hypothetical protein BpHYR1_019896, partial [Brachionus plicatilis]